MGKSKEVWKDIKEYRGKYQVSNFGRVMSTGYIKARSENQIQNYYMVPIWAKNEIILKQYFGHIRYLVITLVSTIGKHNCHSIHSLVAKAFLKKPKYCNQVNHKDGNKLNNHADNLEWVNPSENTIHYTMRRKLVGGHYQKRGNVFACKIRVNGSEYYLGTYKSEEEAHIAYIMGAVFYKVRNKYLEY